MLFVTLPFYLVLLIFGMEIGFLLMSVVLLLRMFKFGLILCLFLLKCWPFWALYIGLLVLLSLALGSVSFVELLILYVQWAGERLCLEAAIPKSRRIGRPISVSAVPFWSRH